MDESKLYRRNEKRLDPFVQTIHVLNENIGMEFVKENVPC